MMSLESTGTLCYHSREDEEKKTHNASELMGSLAGVGPTDVMAGVFGNTDTGPAAPLDGVNPLDNWLVSA